MDSQRGTEPAPNERKVPFLLAVAGAGLLTTGAVLVSGLVGLAIASLVIAGASTRSSASPHRAVPHAAPRIQARLASYSTGYDTDAEGRKFCYVLVGPGGGSFTGTFGDETWGDLKHEIESSTREALWVSLVHAIYVVRDRVTLAEARRILAPLEDIGNRQARLGDLQGRLGRRQADLGELEARLGARQAELSSRIAQSETSSESQAQIERAMWEREIRRAEREQQDLARRQEPLARGQTELSLRQRTLAAEQRRVAVRVNAMMRQLVDEAVAAGRAERVK